MLTVPEEARATCGEIDFFLWRLDCKLVTPLSFFFRGFGPRFVQWKTRPGRFCSRLWFRSFCSTFRSFLWTGFHSDCIRTKKMECSPSVDWRRKNYIIAKLVYTRQLAFSIAHDCSLVAVLILDRAWPVHGLDFESPWHWDELAKVKIKTMKEYFEGNTYKSKPELRNNKMLTDYMYFIYSSERKQLLLPVARSLFTINHG